MMIVHCGGDSQTQKVTHKQSSHGIYKPFEWSSLFLSQITTYLLYVMASEQQMRNPLLVGKAIRAQLEHEIPQDLPLEKDFKEGTGYTITDQYVVQPPHLVFI